MWFFMKLFVNASVCVFLSLLLGSSFVHASDLDAEISEFPSVASQRVLLVSSSDTVRQQMASRRVIPLNSDLKKLQSTLAQQFGSNRLLGSWFWGVLLQAAPADSFLRESLVAVRLVMSGTKEFGTEDVLETMLSSRLSQFRLNADFVTQQKDWLTRLWVAYNTPTNDDLWALPFVTEQLILVAQQPNTPDAIVQAIETLTTVVPAVQAMAVAGEAIFVSVQKLGGSCCK